MGSEISRSALFGKLNSIGYKALEGATVFCKLRGNPYVELAHWIYQFMQLQDADFQRICRHFKVDSARLSKDVIDYLDGLPDGATAIADFASTLEEVTERAWVYGTLMFGATQLRSGHLLVALLKSATLHQALLRLSPEFGRLDSDELVVQFHAIIRGSEEDRLSAHDGFTSQDAVPGEASQAMAPAQLGKQEALKRYAVDLTEKARRGEFDPIVGRDDEIRQIVDILMRRRQNNPILTGEAGVGKTAVVEGFAMRVVAGHVPPALREISVRALDIGLLQAGASMKGEFENRLRQIIDEVQASATPVVLFIDEAHTLIGAGGAAGTGDAANLLKPALARGTLRTIAATTWSEYKKYFEKDPALTRRFQVIQVHEPDEAKALGMMRGIVANLEAHHSVHVLDEALAAAVRLSHRYIPARQLPDKAVSLLDTACARVAISLHAVPPEVDDTRRRIAAWQTEAEIIERERCLGIDVGSRAEEVAQRLAAEQEVLKGWENRWRQEQDLVARIVAVRKQLQMAVQQQGEIETSLVVEEPLHAADSVQGGQVMAMRSVDDLLHELRELQADLVAIQADTPLIAPCVDAQAIATVVGNWTGIPVGRMVKNDIEAVLKLADTLNERVLGQRHALNVIARRVQTSRSNMDNPGRPVGVFLLCGPSGVGKTETALALAEALYGGEQNVITINMSEFQEAHTVSTLKGAPPGYVGYGEGGVLTEAVRRRPYSVVLLDEVEKAHRDVHEIFFQVFDKGWMEDGEGRQINFRNTIILLTSNVGSEVISSLCSDPDLVPEPEGLGQALRQPLLQVFPAALLGRLLVVPYYPLSDELLAGIVRLQLGRVVKRLAEHHKIDMGFSDAVVTLISERCNELESGARVVDAIITNTILPCISARYLEAMLQAQPLRAVKLEVSDNDFAFDFITADEESDGTAKRSIRVEPKPQCVQ